MPAKFTLPHRPTPIEPGAPEGDAHIVGYYAPEQRVNPGAFLGVWGGAEGFSGKQSMENSVRLAYTRANPLSGNWPKHSGWILPSWSSRHPP